MINKTPNPVSRLRKSGIKRSLAAATFSMAAIMTSPAVIIYSQPNTTVISNVATIDVDANGVTEFLLSRASVGPMSFIFTLSKLSPTFDFVSNSTDGQGLSNLSSSVPVNSSSIFSTGNSATIQMSSGSSGYFGFQFNPSGTLLYGWGQLSLSSNGDAITLIDYAYENSGMAINTAAVPEPSAYLLVGLGLAAICYQRKRTRKDAVV